jgi:hypothetical protein
VRDCFLLTDVSLFIIADRLNTSSLCAKWSYPDVLLENRITRAPTVYLVAVYMPAKIPYLETYLHLWQNVIATSVPLQPVFLLQMLFARKLTFNIDYVSRTDIL